MTGIGVSPSPIALDLAAAYKGDKGDKLTYADLTEADKADLRKPLDDAAASATAAAKAANDAASSVSDVKAKADASASSADKAASAATSAGASANAAATAATAAAGKADAAASDAAVAASTARASAAKADAAASSANAAASTANASAAKADSAASDATSAASAANASATKADTAASAANASAAKADAAAASATADTKAAVDSASASVSKAVADAKADVDAAVGRSDAATAKADEAVETANTANAAATKAVTDAQDAIADVKATEAKLYPAAENILVGSETGTVAHVVDAFAGASMRGITVEGACKQDGTPSPDNPVPIQVIENPVVKVTGADTSAVSTSIPFTLPAEHPYLAKLPDGIADTIEVDEAGNVELVARVARVLFDGSQEFNIRKWNIAIFAGWRSDTIRYYNLPMSDRFMHRPFGTEAGAGQIMIGGSPDIWFSFPLNSLLSDSAAVQKIFAEQPTTVFYATSTETRYSLGKIEMQKAQDSIVNVWTDAEVTPNTGIEYVRDVNIVVANLESAIASITKG